MNRFAGRTAIITGASRGIGRAVAQRMVDEGGRVVITARKPEGLAAAIEELGGPDVAIGVPGRGDDVEHQAEAIDRAVASFGSVDVLVNNTGINPAYGPMIELEHGTARKIFEVNALAALSWVQQVQGSWMGEHGGAIVNVASIAGLKPALGIGFYGASKAMLLHITAELAVELGPGVRVNAVAPAVVKTQFAAALYEGREAEVASTYPLKRLGVPGDVAAAVAFLASDDAAWITGQTLVLDGGLTLTGGV